MKRILATCDKCGGASRSDGVKKLKDGTRKRRRKCEKCGNHWQIVISQPLPSKQSAKYNGLWMLWRGYWYSPGEHARIRKVCW